MADRKPGVNEQFCPSCSKIVNQQAPHCPGCGHPISADLDRSTGSNSTDFNLDTETIDERRERRKAQIKEMGESIGENSDSVAVWGKRIGLWGVGLFLLLGGIGSFGSPELSPLVGLPLGIIGLLLLPPVHGIFGRDAELLTFGKRQIVKERTVNDTNRPCVVCSGPVEDGVERTRMKQYLVFGGAVSSSSQGDSMYCRDCANAEFGENYDEVAVELEQTTVEAEGGIEDEKS